MSQTIYFFFRMSLYVNLMVQHHKNPYLLIINSFSVGLVDSMIFRLIHKYVLKKSFN